jgi:hypothetical protein
LDIVLGVGKSFILRKIPDLALEINEVVFYRGSKELSSLGLNPVENLLRMLESSDDGDSELGESELESRFLMRRLRRQSSDRHRLDPTGRSEHLEVPNRVPKDSLDIAGS